MGGASVFKSEGEVRIRVWEQRSEDEGSRGRGGWGEEMGEGADGMP